MLKLGTSVKSGIGAFLKACAPDASSTSDAFETTDLRKPEKTGHPPSKCYGSETSCHSDSW
ncbi:MAG: hypothetical protein ACAH83_10620 [Alphaproteobacteria bacterium]